MIQFGSRRFLGSGKGVLANELSLFPPRIGNVRECEGGPISHLPKEQKPMRAVGFPENSAAEWKNFHVDPFSYSFLLYRDTKML